MLKLLKRGDGGVPPFLFRSSTHGGQRSFALTRPSFSSYIVQVLNTTAALLSNYEVLQLLKELEAGHIARTRTAQRLKKEEDDAAAATGHLPLPSPDQPLTVSENLRTIEAEVRLGRLSLLHRDGF